MSDEKLKLVGPPERPVDKAMNRMDALEKRHDEREASLNEYMEALGGQLDEAFEEVWQLLQIMFTTQGAIIEAVKSLTADPANPMTGAAAARDIITQATEAAYGTDEGSADDGVVPEAEGNSPGDS